MQSNKNGIRILDKSPSLEMKKGRNTGKCSPLKSTTSSRERTGATLGKYRDIWPSVKRRSIHG